jgi:hypothetical protein
MFSKFRFERKRSGEESSRIGAIDSPKSAEMFFETENSECGGLLLLPDESCLAEDEKASLEVHCERTGFHLFGTGSVTFKNVPVKVYLTNYRV